MHRKTNARHFFSPFPNFSLSLSFFLCKKMHRQSNKKCIWTYRGLELGSGSCTKQTPDTQQESSTFIITGLRPGLQRCKGIHLSKDRYDSYQNVKFKEQSESSWMIFHHSHTSPDHCFLSFMFLMLSPTPVIFLNLQLSAFVCSLSHAAWVEKKACPSFFNQPGKCLRKAEKWQ